MEEGFAPEWAELGRDIRRLEGELRGELVKLRSAHLIVLSTQGIPIPPRQALGAGPLSTAALEEWEEGVAKLEARVADINAMVARFNLLVPVVASQRCQVDLAREAGKILAEGYDPNLEQKSEPKKEVGRKDGTVKSFFSNFINKL